MADAQEKLFRYGVYWPIVLMRGQWVPSRLGLLLKSQFDSPDELKALQDKQLVKLLRQVSATVPFYKQFRSLTDTNVDPRAQLAALPTVTKSVLRENEQLFRSSKKHYFLTPKTTGGSTGQPMTIWKTRDAFAWELAAMHRGYAWAGVDVGDRQARFWGVPKGRAQRSRARLIDFVTNRRRVSAFAFDGVEMQRYYDTLASFRPSYAYGYASMLEEFAEFLRRKEGSIGDLKCVISTSEVLSESARQAISVGFNAPVFNEYGSGELGTIAHECAKGRMHLSAENIIVEVADGDRICGPGEEGELVVTELRNGAMPLLRYRTGDIGVVSERCCECGRGLPVLESVKGREYDMLVSTNGKRFHPEVFLYIIEDAKRRNLGVAGFQLIQTEIDRIELKIVRDSVYSDASEEFLRARIAEDFDPACKVAFTYVSRIAREASGKMRIVRSLVGEKQPAVESVE